MPNPKKNKSPDRRRVERAEASSKKANPAKSVAPARARDETNHAEDLSGLTTKKETRVEIKPAKGRPMLTWVGKKPLRHATAYPAQLVESFHASPSPRGRGVPEGRGEVGLLFHGDNKDVLAWLLANGYRGKVKLIYIDPPFDSGADYVRKVELRGARTMKLDGDSYTLGEQTQYSDIWANDNYLQFMYERLLLLKELLAEDGSIYLHSDSHRTHHLRCLMDEVFGMENFRNDIVWQRFNYRADGAKFGTVHDTILLYTKSNNYTFEKPYVAFKESYIKSHFRPDENGRLFRLDNLTAPAHGKQGKALRFGDRAITPPPGTMWRFAQEGINELWSKGLIVAPEDGVPQVVRYLDEIEGQAVHSIWTDLSSINSQSNERTDYPTQKPEVVLERIVQTSSHPNDLVLDCFLGSGTTAAVAQKLGRRWIGADINKGAVQTTIKRLQGVMREQADLSPQPPLPGEMGSQTPQPAQLGFAVYRVNDYDLQIQHNEAFNLAVEHIGMTRTKTDAFFDGTLGRKLVKIVPFNHPVTPLDLEEVKNELKNRPEEERDIVLVGLGKEYAVQAWLDEWNKLRKQGTIPNKIEVIELRSDAKYGGFFTHEPARAKVSFKRGKENMEITIDDFISPTILERLKQQNKDNPLFQPQVSDWRSMVDSVMIDTNYDGEVFNITVADVPERKNDLVEGRYVVAVNQGAVVAVKVTDMLGEEVLELKQV